MPKNFTEIAYNHSLYFNIAYIIIHEAAVFRGMITTCFNPEECLSLFRETIDFPVKRHRAGGEQKKIGSVAARNALRKWSLPAALADYLRADVISAWAYASGGRREDTRSKRPFLLFHD